MNGAVSMVFACLALSGSQSGGLDGGCPETALKLLKLTKASQLSQLGGHTDCGSGRWHSISQRVFSSAAQDSSFLL